MPADVKTSLPPDVQHEIERAVLKCYSCNKCISGCPVAPEMEFPPSVMVKMLAMGRYEKVLESKSIWFCTSCHTCESRCPFSIEIPHIIDLLKEHRYSTVPVKQERAIQLFHRGFIQQIKVFGRIHEMSFMGIWKILSGKWFSDWPLAVKMIKKGKLAIFPERFKYGEMRRLFSHQHKRGEK
jgi:heterodisulfide reductase subunit C